MAVPTPLTVAHGDGIGPEIMAAVLRILREAGASLEIQTIEIGERVYRRGFPSGIEPSAWDSLRRTQVFLKAPITTPQGGGFKSLNVTIRKSLGLFANIRPCIAYPPYVRTLHPKMDLVIVRENEEDLYAGIEYRQTDDVVHCLKIISRPGCERVIRYAFALAVQQGRKKVTCFTKDNIMKLTDGLFHQVFREIAAEYPDIHADHLIVDIGAARLADTPERFDVCVMPNLYGDILSDVAAQISGSVGICGSANLGEQGAMFEAVHGSAPDIAGKGIANPSGLLFSAVMMLEHIGQSETAARIHDAWASTIEAGIHTGDLKSAATKQVVGTEGFAGAVCARLGQKPKTLRAWSRTGDLRAATQAALARVRRTATAHKELVGVDVFVHVRDLNAEALAQRILALGATSWELQAITNRGVKVWPEGLAETFCTDHWRCRFMAAPGTGVVTTEGVIHLLGRLSAVGLPFIKIEMLFTFDGQPGYAQGH